MTELVAVDLERVDPSDQIAQRFLLFFVLTRLDYHRFKHVEGGKPPDCSVRGESQMRDDSFRLNRSLQTGQDRSCAGLAKEDRSFVRKLVAALIHVVHFSLLRFFGLALLPDLARFSFKWIFRLRFVLVSFKGCIWCQQSGQQFCLADNLVNYRLQSFDFLGLLVILELKLV